MRALQRILVGLAWLAVTAAFLLLVVEESGVLTGLVRTRLAWRLGPLGAGLSVERVSLRWFQPGLVVEDLRLRAPRAAGETRAPEELLHLRRASLSLGLDDARPVARLEVQGGLVRISDRLLGALEQATDTLEREAGRSGRLGSPQCSIRDLDVELELPDGTPFPLGRASLLALPDGDGYRLRGGVTPVLGGLVRGTGVVVVDGRRTASGLSIRTAARGLALDSRSFRAPPALASLRLEELSGALTLEGSAHLDWSGERLHTSGELRARVEDGRLLTRPGDPRVEALAGDLELSFDLRGGQALWDREQWSARARASAAWLGAPFTAWGTFGRELPEGTWAHAWARCGALRPSEELLLALGADERRRALLRSLAPRGTTPATLDVRLAPPRLEDGALRWSAPELAVALEPAGELGLTYVGEPDEEGRARGMPLPLEAVRGRALLAARPADGGFARLWFEVEGEHPSGRARARGGASSPERPGEASRLDIELASERVLVDDALRRALAGNHATAGVWQDYQPQGGELSFLWRLYEDAGTRGLTGSGDIALRGVSCAWHELPIPFERAGGTLALRWARRSAWATPDRSRVVRPAGLAYRFSNAESPPEGKAARASVSGFVRDDFRTLDDPADVPERKTQALSIAIDELFLRGRDWDALARRFPGVAQPVEELGAKGGARVRFDGGRAAPAEAYRTALEVAPTQAELTPRSFRRRTQDLRGRVLVETEELGPVSTVSTTRLALAGAWSGGVDLACRGELYSGLPSQVLVHGAGVDPANTSFRGALLQALGAAESGGDVSESALEGRLDFTVQSELVPSSEVAPANLYRVFLRDNALSNGSLRLEDLHGVLVQRSEVLGSPRLTAALAGHPLELRDVRVFRLADAARLAIADPILQRPTFWSDPDGYALQAELHVHDLPLDDRHLSSLLGEETLAAFRDNPDWRGALDVDGAQLVVTSERGLAGKVAVRGDVRPHDLAMRFGIPIEVPHALVQIEELIFEGGRVRGWGRARDLDASFLERRLSEARMLFSYVDGRLSIDNLEGAFEGGRLESLGGEGQGTRKALAFDLAPPYHFDLALRLGRVQVASLLEGVFQSSVADAGVIDAGLRLRGKPRDVLGISGGGWFELDEGRLWSIPVMRALFQTLGSDNTAVFDRMRAHFEVQDGRIRTTDVRVRSALLNLVGSGWIDFDGRLSYDLEARYSLLDRLGPLNRILYWLNNSLWRVAVRGDMARPRVSIRNAVLEFLSGFDEHPARQLPLPDFGAFPERF